MPVADSLIIRMRAVGGRAAATEVREAEHSIHRLREAARFTAGAAGLGTLAFGLQDVTKTAISFQEQQSQLHNSLAKSHITSAGAMEHLVSAADTLSTHGGLSPAQSLGMLQRLLDVTHNTSKAERDLGIATGLVRGHYGSYNAILRAVLNVEQGRTTGLGRLAIVVPKVHKAQDALAASTKHATVAQRNHAKALDEAAGKHIAMQHLMDLSRGRTEAFSRTASGAASNFRNAIDVFMQRLGSMTLPLIVKVLRYLTHGLDDLGKWVQRNKKTLNDVKSVLHGIFKAVVDVIGFIVQLSFSDTPLIGWKWWFNLGKAMVKWFVGAWHWIKQATTDTIHWFAGVGQTLVGFFVPIGKRIAAIFVGAFHVVKTVVLAVAHWFEGVGKYFYRAFEPPVRRIIIIFKGAFGIVKSIVIGVFNAVKGPVQAVWNFVSGIIRGFVRWLTGLFGGGKGGHGGGGVVGSVLSAPFNFVKDIAVGVFNWIKNNVVQPAIDFIKKYWPAVSSVLTAPFRLLKTIVDQLQGPLSTVLGWAKDLVNALGQVGTSTTSISGHGSAAQKAQAQALLKHAQGRLATGGPVGVGGAYMVGERGPERVFLPGGSYVQPNHALGGGHVLDNHVVLSIDGNQFARALIRTQTKQKAVR